MFKDKVPRSLNLSVNLICPRELWSIGIGVGDEQRRHALEVTIALGGPSVQKAVG